MPVNAFGQFILPRFCDSCRQRFEGLAHKIPCIQKFEFMTATLCGDCMEKFRKMPKERQRDFLAGLEIQQEGW